ncbi:MAG: LVIVD repeat-containing protein, partial [Promethearchaeota archaeon]
MGIKVQNNIAYVADGPTGVAIINVTNLLDPVTLTYQITNNDAASGLIIYNDFAYVASGDGATGGLSVFDVSDPSNPGIPTYRSTSDYAYDIDLNGDFAYVAVGDSGVAIINVSDTSDLGLPKYVLLTADAYDIDVHGEYAYVAADTSGLAVIEIADLDAPIINDIPDDIFLGVGYSGLTISWTATDDNPATYTIERVGFGIEISPTSWSDGVQIDFDVPTGLAMGDYTFIINVTDDYGNNKTDSVILSVHEIDDPVITVSPPDIDVAIGYSGITFSWTATDDNAATYTIERVGFGIVVSPTSWTNSSSIDYEVPTGFSLGDYTYIINITDDYGNYNTDSVNLTVHEMELPVFTVSPPDIDVAIGNSGTTFSWTATDDNPATYTIERVGFGIIVPPTSWSDGNPIDCETITWLPLGDYTSPDIDVGIGYSGISFSWTATDDNPATYTIERVGFGIVVPSTSWSDSVPIIYNVPDGLALGAYTFIINVSDVYGYYETNSVSLIVLEMDQPVFIGVPAGMPIEAGYSGETLSWAATDDNPATYTIERVGSGIVVPSTSWSDGVTIIYDIPDGLTVGDYTFIINITDDYGNFNTHSVTFMVYELDAPVITDASEDILLGVGYSGETISWTATDDSPATYTIERVGSGIVVPSTSWSDGVPIIYDIPDGLTVGDYTFIINITDDYGNFNTDSITLTVHEMDRPVITEAPIDVSVEVGYSEVNISWTVTDNNPATYTIEREDSGVVVSSTTWYDSVPIIYDIPDGLAIGNYTFIIIVLDHFGNNITDSVLIEIIPIENNPGISFGFYFLYFIPIGIIFLIKKYKTILNYHEN